MIPSAPVPSLFTPECWLVEMRSVAGEGHSQTASLMISAGKIDGCSQAGCLHLPVSQERVRLP